MKRLFLLITALAALTGCALIPYTPPEVPSSLPVAYTGSGTAYYVSPLGDDSASGSESAPWKTLDRVNQASLDPGDSVLFEAGGTYRGQLIPRFRRRRGRCSLRELRRRGETPSHRFTQPLRLVLLGSIGLPIQDNLPSWL